MAARVIVALLLVVALLGCGDGATEDYKERVIALNEGNIATLHEVIRTEDYAAGVVAAEETLAELKELEPPEELREQHNLVIRSYEAQIEGFRTANQGGIREATGHLRESQAYMQRATEKIRESRDSEAD